MSSYLLIFKMNAQVALHRSQLKDEEVQSKKREQHLDFLVGQTEKFSKMIAADMQGVTPTLTNGVSNSATASASAMDLSGDALQ